MPSYYDEYHKTPQSKRDTYIYKVTYSDGTVVKITLRPPENEEERELVKETSEAIYLPRFHKEGDNLIELVNDKVYLTSSENIRWLHLNDDKIVRQNIKENSPKLSKKETAVLKQWIINHPGEDIPPRKNVSLHAFESNEAADRFLSTHGGYQIEESEEVMLVRITAQSKLNDIQFVIFSMRYQLYTNKDIGDYLGLDESTIRHHVKKIAEIMSKEIKKF